MATSLPERHDAALKRAMELSRQRQQLQQQLAATEQEMMRIAGQIDLLVEMMASEAEVPNG